MEKNREEVEQKIFEIFLIILKEESSAERQKKVGQLWDAIIKWSKKYLKLNTDDMGMEIFEIIRQITNKEGNANTPKNKKGFFSFLKGSIDNAGYAFFNSFETDSIHIPIEKMRKIRRMNDVIAMEEKNMCKELSKDEKIKCITGWFNLSEMEANQYIMFMNMTRVDSLDADLGNNDNGTKTTLHDLEIKSSYLENNSIDPLDKHFLKLNDKKKCDALKYVLQKTQTRTREKDRALYTVYCINNSIDFEGLTKFLNKEVLNDFIQNKKKPLQYEIFLKYHDGIKESITKESAEAMASERLKIFRRKLEKASR